MKVDRGQPAELVVSLESPLPELVRRERERREEKGREEGRRLCALLPAECVPLTHTQRDSLCFQALS